MIRWLECPWDIEKHDSYAPRVGAAETHAAAAIVWKARQPRPLKLGLTVSQTAVSKYMLRPRATAVAGAASVLEESRLGSDGRGFLHGANGDLSSAVRARGAEPHFLHFHGTLHSGAREGDGLLPGGHSCHAARLARPSHVSLPGGQLTYLQHGRVMLQLRIERHDVVEGK